MQGDSHLVGTVRVGCLAQGLLNTQLGGAGDRTSNLPVAIQPCSNLPLHNKHYVTYDSHGSTMSPDRPWRLAVSARQRALTSRTRLSRHHPGSSPVARGTQARGPRQGPTPSLHVERAAEKTQDEGARTWDPHRVRWVGRGSTSPGTVAMTTDDLRRDAQHGARDRGRADAESRTAPSFVSHCAPLGWRPHWYTLPGARAGDEVWSLSTWN